MKNWINKVFNKKKVIKVNFLTLDRKIKLHYVKPSTNKITVFNNKVGHDFMFNPEQVYIHNGFSTVFVIEGQAEVVDMFTFTAAFDSEQYHVAMNNKLAEQFVRSNQKKETNIQTVLLIGVLGALAITIYFIFDMQGALRSIIDRLNTTTQFISVIFRG